MKYLRLLLHHFERLLERIPQVRAWGVRRVARILAIGVGLLLVISILSSLSGGDVFSRHWAVVQQGDFIVDLVESGDVEAVSQLLISAPMMWGSQLKVVDVVPEGSQVKSGDLLILFDTSDLEDDKTLREDQLESLNADLEKLKAQQALTISNQENSLLIAQYSYEQATLQLEMRKYESQARQEEARLQLKQSEIELNKVRKQLEFQKIIHQSQIVQMQTSIRESENRLESVIDRIARLHLHAPADGMVVYQQVRGERVKEGLEVRPGWPLMSIPDLSRMQVKLYINEVDRLKINPGQEAFIVLDAFPEDEFGGSVREVTRLASVVTGEERLKGFEVYIDIDRADPKLKPGLTAQVRIVLDNYEDVVFAPLGAVFEVNGQPVVFPKGKERPSAVYLGVRNDGYVIIERGLRPGMRLAWTPPEARAVILGLAAEKIRINETQRTLEESFAVFENRGILFNYGGADGSSKASGKKSGIDLDRLPASIRNRLQPSEGAEDKPAVEVGEPDSRRKSGTFRVSPEMMKRLQKRDDSKQSEGTSSEKE